MDYEDQMKVALQRSIASHREEEEERGWQTAGKPLRVNQQQKPMQQPQRSQQWQQPQQRSQQCQRPQPQQVHRPQQQPQRPQQQSQMSQHWQLLLDENARRDEEALKDRAQRDEDAHKDRARRDEAALKDRAERDARHADLLLAIDRQVKEARMNKQMLDAAAVKALIEASRTHEERRKQQTLFDDLRAFGNSGFIWSARGDTLTIRTANGKAHRLLTIPIFGDGRCLYYCKMTAALAAGQEDISDMYRGDYVWGDACELIDFINNREQSMFTRLVVLCRDRPNTSARDTRDETRVWGTYIRDPAVGPDVGSTLYVVNYDGRHFAIMVAI